MAITAVAQPPPATQAAAGSIDSRPRLAVVGFESDPGGDPRDAWLATAFEELLSQRLRRVPGLLVVPVIRLHQGRSELQEASAPPPWPDVIRHLGASHYLTGRCRGSPSAVGLELTLRDVTSTDATERTATIPATRVFDTLDDATRWVLQCFDLAPLEESLSVRVFATPSRSTAAVEYYARAIAAVRAGDGRAALRYGARSLSRDGRFRPALGLLAQLEAQGGPADRRLAGQRLRALGDLARLEGDPLDRIRAEIGQALLLQLAGGFEAACTRAETALTIAYEHRDIYGQIAAMTTICDLYLTRPMPTLPGLSDATLEQVARQNVGWAAEWQEALVDTLDVLGDKLGGLPATNKLAVIHERLGDTERALKLHRRTLALATELSSPVHQATAWLYLGQWYADQDRFDEALDALGQCLALAEEASKSTVRMITGEVYQAMGRPAEALTQYESAYEDIRKTDDLLSQFTCWRQIALTRMQLGQRPEAIAALREALDLAHVLELRAENQLRERLNAWKAGGP